MLKARRRFWIALIVSVVLHLIFVTGSFQVNIRGAHFQPIVNKRTFKIKTLQENLPAKSAAQQSPEEQKFKEPELTEPNLSFKNPNDVPAKKETLLKKDTRQVDKTVNAKERDLSELFRDLPQAKALKQKEVRQTRQDLVEITPTVERKMVTADELVKEKPMDEAFYEKMPGFTPSLVTDEDIEHQKDVELKHSFLPAVQRKQIYEDLEEYLVSELQTYTDPKDGQKYFKLVIKVGKATKELPALPKEILFLIDCSISIQKDRLEEFKSGIEYALRNLGENDTFNILAFRDEITRFKPNSVSPNQNTITQAVRFVENLTAGAKTDTYNALNESIKTKIVQTPSYIILLSDGRSTEGVTDSTKIINEISTYNNGRRSIFAFSGGLRVNRYLLDFISYKNRGWTEYSYRTHLIDEHLTSMYEKIKDPIFLNLRYRSNGLNTGEMFPKILPDFFRNAEFTLYGIYDEQDQFVLQLLADFKGKTKEFIMQGKLQSAPQGSEDIAKNWAFNKIYYLISSLEHDKKNDAIIKQIRELSEKFNIDTPYSGDIADIDLH